MHMTTVTGYVMTTILMVPWDIACQRKRSGSSPAGREQRRPSTRAIVENNYDLYDMHGNLWEWCNDRYGDYEGDETNPVGPGSGMFRVLRGGSWTTQGGHCRSAERDGSIPNMSFRSFGFRHVRSSN